MATGLLPLPLFNYMEPFSGIWYSPITGFYTIVPFPLQSSIPLYSPNTMTMPIQTIPLTYTNTNFTCIAGEIRDEEPMHQLEPEKPMDVQVQEECRQRLQNGYESKFEEEKEGNDDSDEVDYSDMPQLTRMDY